MRNDCGGVAFIHTLYWTLCESVQICASIVLPWFVEDKEVTFLLPPE